MAGVVAGALATGLGGQAIAGAFQIAPAIIKAMGKDKKAAGSVLRYVETDVRLVIMKLSAEGPLSDEMRLFCIDLLSRAADGMDKTADILVGEDDK